MSDRSADDLSKDPQEKPEESPSFLDPVVKSNDPKQLKKKAIDDKSKALKQENDLREVLNTQAGVRLVARILSDMCFIDVSPFHPSNSTMCNIAGRRQIALELKTLIRDVDFELWIKVDREIELTRLKPRSSERKN